MYLVDYKEGNLSKYDFLSRWYEEIGYNPTSEITLDFAHLIWRSKLELKVLQQQIADGIVPSFIGDGLP
jgi:hypothetical protein